jgi:transposase
MHHLSTDLKLRAIQHYLQNHNYVETSELFQVPRTTLMRWVQRYQTDNTVKRKEREFVAYKVHSKHVIKAKELLRKDPTTTMKQLTEKLGEEFDDFDVTPQWFGEVLRDNNLTRKRTRINHQPEKRYNKDINIQDELNKFYAKVKKYPIDKIISIDESSIEPFRAKSYSRCRLGRRCVVKTKDNVVFQKFSLIVAVTTKGAQLWHMYDKGSVFAERLEEFLQTLLENKKGFLVLLDNAPAHKKASIEELIRKTGNELLYTVPYQPKTNAVEQIFSELKHHLSDGVTRKFPELKKAVEKILENTIPIEHFRNHFMYAYVEKAERGKKPSTRQREPPKYKTV